MTGPTRPKLIAAGLSVLAAGWAAACGSSPSPSAQTVTIHGNLVKNVGLACPFLSAGVPPVSGRTVTFFDPTGKTVGSTKSGAQTQTDEPNGSCRLTAPYSTSLPTLTSYVADVSSPVTTIPRTQPLPYEDLASRGWELNLTVPDTA